MRVGNDTSQDGLGDFSAGIEPCPSCIPRSKKAFFNKLRRGPDSGRGRAAFTRFLPLIQGDKRAHGGHGLVGRADNPVAGLIDFLDPVGAPAYHAGQGKSKACFATLAERKTRFYIVVKMPDRRAQTMENAIVAALSAFPPQLVKTITCDRGTEFANWRRIEERLHCEVYFADPYCAWQKGTNENLNGLLREFYPKGRNLSRVAPATLKRNLALLNARPRKVLNFHSTQELWDFELNSCCT